MPKADFQTQLNDLLTRAYRSIGDLEARMLRDTKGLNLTISELHLLQAVGPPAACPQGLTVSEISDRLALSLPTVTLTINRLVKKGFVEKRKSLSDGRVVHVLLTRSGVRAYRVHAYFHRKMGASIAEELADEEKTAMIKGMVKLNEFFDRSLRKGGNRQ